MKHPFPTIKADLRTVGELDERVFLLEAKLRKVLVRLDALEAREKATCGDVLKKVEEKL